MTHSPPLIAETESVPMDEGTHLVDPALTDLNRTSLMAVSIEQIQPYERNPRHVPNPEYDRIRDSIRTQGLDQPLVITQRPGAADYIVHAGGNTRLLILKELFEKTGDTRYAQVLCLYRHWNRESDVLLAHLRENDLRGNLSFIDKARAVCDARVLLAQEFELQEVTQQRLETELRRSGYRVSQGLISQMEYAVYRLLPLIPLALEGGLGRPKVARIRVLERAARSVWHQRCVDDLDAFEDAFTTLCRRYDGLEWETDLLREALENELAETAEINIQTMRVMLDAELAGRQLVIPEVEPESENETTQVDHDKPDIPSDESDDRDDPKDAHWAAGSADLEITGSSEQLGSAAGLAPITEQGDEPESADLESLTDLLITSETAPTDLKSLRGRAWTLAARLAQRHGFGELVEPLSGKGLGYVLRDVPDPGLAEQLDEESLSQLSMLWWQLAACAEMTFAPLESILPLLPTDSILRRSLETQDADLLFTSIWTLDPGHTGYRLWRLLDDRDWQDLLNLMDTYRRLRRSAADTGTAIWE